MNRRGKRLTLAVISVGVAVVVVLAIAYRKPILEHVEAWHFQLTRKTVRIAPVWRGRPRDIEGVAMNRTHLRKRNEARWERVYSYALVDLVRLVADCSGFPVIVDSALLTPSILRRSFGPIRITADSAPGYLQEAGWRILEQRFPRKAYVVMRDKDATR